MIRARKRFGQHFLEPAWVDKLVRAIDPRSDETFIEIGPGRGALTRPLAARAGRVIAYEIDRDLARALRDEQLPNVTVVEGDFLEQPLIGPGFALGALAPSRQPPAPSPVRVAANLPYNVAAPILFRLIDAYLDGAPIVDATVMLQREVADRLVAVPGTKDYGVLAVLIGHVARVERVFHLPPGAFRPPPKVRSTVVRLAFHPPQPRVQDRKVFEMLVQAVFTHRRKTLANALRAASLDAGPKSCATDGELQSCAAMLRRRPETLTIAEFAALADVFSSR